MAAGEETIIKAAADKLRAVREKNQAPPAAVTPPAVAPETPPLTPPAGEAPQTPERGDDGKFKKREMTEQEKGLLAGVRAEREKRKALEGTLSSLQKEIDALKNQSRSVVAPDKRAELLKKAPEETQKFWGEVADPVVRSTVEEEVNKRLAEYRPALEAFQAIRAKESEATAFRNDLTEFAEEMALEGVEFDPAALVNKINEFETEHDISLGSTNRRKFENAVRLLMTAPTAQRPSEEAAAKAKLEAEAKVRAGGVSPSTTTTPQPPDVRATTQAKVRDLARTGDFRGIADIIRSKVKAHPLR